MFVALAVVWFLAAPYLTAYRMSLAAENRDSAQVARFIDFERVRESVRPQVQGEVSDQVADVSDDAGVQAAASVLGGALADRAVDRYVTPEGIAALMRTAGDPDEAGGAGMDDIAVAAGYRSLNRFAVVLTDPDSGREVELVLTRAGLGWMVTEVQLPTGSG